MERTHGKKVKLGILQVQPNYEWTIEERLAHLYNLTEKCLSEGAELVCLPEAYQYMGQERNALGFAEKYAQAHKEACAALASKYNAYVVPWDYEISEGKIYNTSYILDRTGKEVGRFRKVHLTYGEMQIGLARGDSFPVFDLDIGKVGIMICFDNYFPESSRILALNGADIILYPLYGDTIKPGWELKARARASDNSVYVLPCQIHGAIHPEVTFSGLIDPQGNWAVKLLNEGEYAVVEAELGMQVLECPNGVAEDWHDMKQYLLKARNPAAYSDIMRAVATPEWWKILPGCEDDWKDLPSIS